MFKRILFPIILLAFIQHTQAVVIVVHGSFASTTSWPQPDGDFFKELEHQAQQLEQSVVSFCWSGIPTDQEIVKGGKMLAQLIMSYPDNEKIILVGHSHGGNVINIASQLLYKLSQQENPEFLTQTNPIVLQIPMLVAASTWDLLATTKTSSQSTNLIPQEPSFQNLLTQAVRELRIWSTKFLTRSNPTPSIEFSYLLGTPVNTAKFWPHMEIIKHIILFYSDSDLVQPVMGLFQRTYPADNCRANVKVKLYTLNKDGTAPSHSNLHHPIIGRWLLCIPKILTQLKIGNFESFKFGTDGEISFYTNKAPYYSA